jgi:hypothetical protein
LDQKDRFDSVHLRLLNPPQRSSVKAGRSSRGFAPEINECSVCPVSFGDRRVARPGKLTGAAFALYRSAIIEWLARKINECGVCRVSFGDLRVARPGKLTGAALSRIVQTRAAERSARGLDVASNSLCPSSVLLRRY